MIRKLHFLFCDNEHGTGDVCLPDPDAMGGNSFKHEIVTGNSIKSLRAQAKAEGWGRVNGGDYCPQCMESGI